MRHLALVPLALFFASCGQEDSHPTPVSVKGSFELVDDIHSTSWVRLRFTPQGVPVISYHQSESDGPGSLFIAYPSGDGWKYERIADGGSAATLAFDASGTWHFTHQAKGEGHLAQLRHLWGSPGTGWESEVIEPDGYAGPWNDAVFDAEGRLHVTYFSGVPDYDLWYAVRSGSGWTRTRVDGDGDTGYMATIHVDNRGEPVLVYSRATSPGRLLAARERDGAWHPEVLEEGGAYVWGPAGEDAGHGLRVAYRTSNDAVRVGRLSGNSWTSQAVFDNGKPEDPDTGEPSLAVDSQGRSWVAIGGKPPRIAFQDGLLWTVLILEGAQEAYRPVIAIGPEDEILVALWERTGGLWAGVLTPEWDSRGPHGTLNP